MNPLSTTITFPSDLCIIVDFFKGLSPVYFLSHFHTDHVAGIKEIQHQCKIYCSSITKLLVLANLEYKAVHHLLEDLPVGSSRRSLPELPGVAVTLVPAGHCLGSVMFLFEEVRDGGYVALHTGDFRIPTELEALKSIDAFHRNGRVIPIDYAVVDTTFFTSHCHQLPSREESLLAICNLVGDCLDRAGGSGIGGQPFNHCRHRQDQAGVVLVSKARFSYEYVYQGLADRFGIKVHISKDSLRYYGQLGTTLTFYSTRPDECFVHLDGCGCETHRMLNICLSTMYFDKMAGFSQTVVWVSERTARVLFSFHPSMCEVEDLLAYLRPRAVRALVTPDGDSDDGVQARLEAALAALHALLPPLIANKRRRFDFSSPASSASIAASGDDDQRGPRGDEKGSDSDGDDSMCAAPGAGAFSKMARLS